MESMLLVNNGPLNWPIFFITNNESDRLLALKKIQVNVMRINVITTLHML